MNHIHTKQLLNSKFAIAPLALLILSGCSQASSQANIEPQKVERPVQVITLTDQQLQNSKQFTGVLEATKTASLSFKVPGTIEAILVKTGDKVDKGQVIARLDPHDYQVTVVELEARLAEANAAHQLAKVELDRVSQAIADDAISEVNLDRAQSGYQRSLAMVQVVTQNLQKANDALDYTELKAPFNGVIGLQTQQTFEQTSPGAGLFSLHQPNELKAIIDVPENLIGNLTLSQKASVTWHGNNQPINAYLTEMNTLADPIKQTYQAQFVLDKNQQSALPGKSVSVTINLNASTDTFCVPLASLKGEGELQSVYVIENEKVTERVVEVESVHSNRVCISGALQAGDSIVTAGVHYLKPLQIVKNTIAKKVSY